MGNKTVSVELKAKVDNYMSNMKRANSAAKDFEGRSKKAQSQYSDTWKRASLAAGVGAVAIAVGMKKAIDAASDLNEATEKSGQVFGNHNKAMVQWASGTANALGISKRAALDTAATYGNLFTAFGVGQDKAAGMSRELVELAADLASFGNTSVDQALTAISSGLAGEMEPLKRYGVILSDVRLRQQAFEDGLISSTKGGLDPQTRALAAHSLMLKDTANAQGDAARMAEQGAQAQRRVAANFEDQKAALGEGLLPVWTTFMKVINGGLGALDRLPGPLKTGATLIALLGLAAFAAGPKILAWRTALQGSNLAVGKLGKTLKAAGIVTAVWAIGTALGAAFSGDRANVSALEGELRKFGETGELTGSMLENAGGDFGEFRDRLRLIADPNLYQQIENGVAGFGGAIFGMQTDLSRATETFEDFDTSLTSLFAQDPGKALQIWDSFKTQAEAADVSLQDLEARFPGFKSALDQAASSTEGGAAALDKLKDSAGATEAQIKAVDSAFDSLMAAFDEERAAIAFEETLASLSDGLKDYSGKQLSAARSMDISTEAGRNTKSMLMDLINNGQKAAQVHYDQAAAAKGDAVARREANAILQTHKSQILDTAKALGLNKRQVALLVDKMGELGQTEASPKINIPNHVKKEIAAIDREIQKLSGRELTLRAAGAVTEADRLQKKIDSLKQKRQIVLQGTSKVLLAEANKADKRINSVKQNRPTSIKAQDDTRSGVQAAKTTLNSVHDKTVTITTKYKTIAPFVSKAAQDKAVGPRRAGGGPVYGPGTSTSDSIITALSNGEHVIKTSSATKNRRRLEYVNRTGQWPNRDEIPGYAKGGKVTLSQKLKKGASGTYGKAVQSAVKLYNTRLQAQKDRANELKQVRDNRASHIAGVRGSISGGTVSVFDLKAYAQAQEDTARAVEAQADAQKNLTEAKRRANQATNPADRKAALLELREAQQKYADSVQATADAKKAEAAAKPTKANIITSAKNKAAQARTFLANIKKMQSLGFHPAIIRDVISKGLDEGSEWAAILATFSVADRNEYNAAWASLDSASAGIGTIDANLTPGVNLAAVNAAAKKLTTATKATASAKKVVAKAKPKAKKKAAGGRMYGPGTTTSDSIPSMLSRDEFVIKAASAQGNYPELEYLNRYGEWPQGFALGGLVGTSMSMSSSAGRGAPVQVHLTIEQDSRAVWQGIVDLGERTNGQIPAARIKVK